jgi:hypothetical protein
MFVMIHYTGHAKERMLLREITEEMIKKALASPDKIDIGYDSRDLVFKKFPKGITSFPAVSAAGSL